MVQWGDKFVIFLIRFLLSLLPHKLSHISSVLFFLRTQKKKQSKILRTMATQAAAYAVKQQVISGPPQVGSPNGGDEQQETKPAGWREWILRVGAVGNCKFICFVTSSGSYSFSSDIFALCF